jgi:hypothetical protein
MSANNPIIKEFSMDSSDTQVDIPFGSYVPYKDPRPTQDDLSLNNYLRSSKPFVDQNPTQVDIPLITEDVRNNVGSAYSTDKYFGPALTLSDLKELEAETQTIEIQKLSKTLYFLMAIALTSGALYAYLDGFKSNSVVDASKSQVSVALQTNDAVRDILQPQDKTVGPTPIIDLVPQTFQDQQAIPKNTSVEIAENFVADFDDLKQIILDLNVRKRVAYENFNSVVFTNKLIHIARNYNREQKMQVYDYLEGLSIIPSSAKDIMEKNISALIKIYDYLRDYQGESKVERQERVKQRAYSLLLRAVVERSPIEELTFIINSFNPSAQLSNNSSYIDVIEAIGNDSEYNLDADRIMSIQPFESNGLYSDVNFFRDIYSQIIPHADILTARTITATGIHETAPRFTQVENQEQANMLLLELYDYNPWNIVRFENGILTLGPTQLQDWNILFERFPQAIQDKVIALGANMGIEVTDIVSAMRAAVLSPEIQFLLSTSLMSVNYETLYNNISEFRTASIPTQRRALILSNKIGAGSKGIRVIRQMLTNNSWDQHGYVKSTYKYITLLQTVFR